MIKKNGHPEFDLIKNSKLQKKTANNGYFQCLVLNEVTNTIFV